MRLTAGVKRVGIEWAEPVSAMSSCALATLVSLSVRGKVFQVFPNVTSSTGMWMRTDAARKTASSNQKVLALAVYAGISRGPMVSLRAVRFEA